MKKGRVMIAVKYSFLLMAGGLFSLCSAQATDVRGNWRKKSEWRAEAQQEVAQIPALVDKIVAGRPDFDQKVAAIRASLADFYQHQKIDEATTNKLIADIKQYLDEMRTLLITENLENDDNGESVVTADIAAWGEKKEAVDKLGLLLQDLQQAEPTLAGYIKKYDEIQQQAEDARSKSESLFNEIDSMLNHVRAEQQYYVINALKETLIKQIEYLEGVFTSSLDALRDTLADRITQAETRIAELESENVFVQDRVARVIAEKERQAELDRAIAEEEARRKQGKKPWYAKFYDSVTSFFAGLFSSKKPVVVNNTIEETAIDTSLPNNKE